jgi:hypothetical protein
VARFGWREQHTIVFDHLVAPTAFYVARAEFESWWREIEATGVEVGWHNQNSWRGFGKIGREPVAACQGSGNGAGGGT